MPVVRVRDIDVYYEQAGEGPRLLFIGGTGGDLRQKPNTLDGPLVRHFETLTYDQRGLGQTSKPPGPYSMADYANDAAGLLDALGWERAHVVGVSFGGMVAQELTLRHPDRVERLALVCTSSGGAGGASYPLHTLSDLPLAERAVRAVEMSDTRNDAAWREANSETYQQLLAGLAGRARIAESDASLDRQAERGAALQLEARSHHDTWERLPAIETPTFVAGGRYDGIAPVSNQQALASQIPGALLELFEGGHLFLMQDRRAFGRIIEFLETPS